MPIRAISMSYIILFPMLVSTMIIDQKLKLGHDEVNPCMWLRRRCAGDGKGSDLAFWLLCIPSQMARQPWEGRGMGGLLEARRSCFQVQPQAGFQCHLERRFAKLAKRGRTRLRQECWEILPGGWQLRCLRFWLEVQPADALPGLRQWNTEPRNFSSSQTQTGSCWKEAAPGWAFRSTAAICCFARWANIIDRWFFWLSWGPLDSRSVGGQRPDEGCRSLFSYIGFSVCSCVAL